MSKVIWMSDPHFVAEGEVLGHDPRARLAAAIAHVNAHHRDAALCVMSGDMVNRGTEMDYAGLKAMLAELVIPVCPMVGNHDDRALLRAALSVPDSAMEAFVQYEIDAGDARLLLLDTQRAGADAGEFCTTRRQWLKTVLDHDPEKPAILFMHHPPMDLGLPMQDMDRMQDGDGFLDLLAAHRSVRFLCIGHVHRPIAGTVRGIPFATMRSLLYQAPAPRPAWDWDNFQPAGEAPQLGVLYLSGGDVTLQFEEFNA